MATAGAKRKREADTLASARREARSKAKNSGAIEDAFVKWIKPLLEEHDFVVVVMEEFRAADVLVRHLSWPDETYVRIQAKADGGMHLDGTPKALTATPHFKSTLGYGAMMNSDGQTLSDMPGRMLMLCGVKRVKHDSTAAEVVAAPYMLWCVDGTQVNNNRLNVSVVAKGSTLGPLRNYPTSGCAERASPVSVKSVVACIHNAYSDADFPKTTYLAAMLDVKRDTQRKELVLMLCLQRACDPSLSFPVGFQTAIDCLFLQKDTQFKTINVDTRSAGCSHTVKGEQNVPYDVRDGIALFVAGFLLQHNEPEKPPRFFFFHAMETGADMLNKDRFTDIANGKHTASTGFSPRIPEKYYNWIYDSKCKSYESKLLPFKDPVEVFARGALTERLLLEVAHVAANPAAMPMDRNTLTTEEDAPGDSNSHCAVIAEGNEVGRHLFTASGTPGVSFANVKCERNEQITLIKKSEGSYVLVKI